MPLALQPPQHVARAVEAMNALRSTGLEAEGSFMWNDAQTRRFDREFPRCCAFWCKFSSRVSAVPSDYSTRKTSIGLASPDSLTGWRRFEPPKNVRSARP